MNLEKLNTPMPYKWREQSVNAQGATMVAYIDARQLFDKLDEVVGSQNWQSDFKLIDGKLFGGIGINVNAENTDLPPHWVWKWDTGTESNVDKEKGEVSDAVKRAGVQWGCGRFLYSLGIVKLKSADYNGKWKPADDSGKIIWSKEELTQLCMKAIEEGVLDRTRIKVTGNATTTTPKQPSTPVKAPEATKPYLNAGDSNYKNVVDALKNGLATVVDVEKKYRLSATMKKELLDLVVKK